MTRNVTAEAGGGPWHWLMQDTMDGLRRRRALLGYLFLLPTLLGIFVFTAGPVFVSLVSACFSGISSSRRISSGWRTLSVCWRTGAVIIGLINTLKFTVLAVTSQVTIGLILALAVHRINRIWLRYYFRTAFFLPLLMSGASVAVFMGYIFHKEFGPLNYYLDAAGHTADTLADLIRPGDDIHRDHLGLAQYGFHIFDFPRRVVESIAGSPGCGRCRWRAGLAPLVVGDDSVAEPTDSFRHRHRCDWRAAGL